MTYFVRRIFLLLFSVVLISLTSCTDEGGFLSVANLEVLDTNGNPVSNIRLLLSQDDQYESEMQEGSGIGGASYVTDIFGKARIKYFSSEGTQSIIYVLAEVYDDERSMVLCSYSERIFENREQDFVVYVNPPTIPISIDLSNALQDSTLLAGKEFIMGLSRRSGGCFIGLASISSTEIKSDENIDILVYPNSEYILTFFNHRTSMQDIINFSVDSTAQTIVY